MANSHNSTKRIQINKAQATVIGVIAGAVFVTVFSLVSAKALWTQRSYQARVIDKKVSARDQLEKNVSAVKDLESAYKNFASNPNNIIGGNPTGTGEKDGDNARIVLDALPSKYDFPALASSLEKILLDKKFKIDGITGTDDEIAQSAVADSGDPKPIDIPFQVSVNGSYASIQDLVSVFERSIRPINLQKISFSGGSGSMQVSFDAKTYFQPEKSLNIKMEDVK